MSGKEAVACAVLGAAVASIATWALRTANGRRFWLGVEDPRAMAALRIAFATLAVCNVNGLWEHFMFLFTDEGIFPAAVAREVFAKQQFAGFGDGTSVDEPWGFFDGLAVLEFLRGPKFSLLYFWDTPTAMWIHIAVFELVMLAMIVGLWTRWSAVLGFVLVSSLFDRNPLFSEGTELVFRVFFFYLLFARSGEAWSVDAWWRRRRARRRDLGVEVGAPRSIPTWPRKLMMLQLAAIYLVTGCLKHGAVWIRGDAVYYALNLDHFYRLEPQMVAAVLGTNLLRAATWFVRLGEIMFALVFVGEVLRSSLDVPHARPRPRWSWIRRWLLGRRIWLTWAVATMGGIWLTMNLGQFQTVMLCLGLVYVRGEELGAGLRWCGRRLGSPSTSAELGAAPPAGGALAYGPLGRTTIAIGLAWHITAVAIWLLPEIDRLGGVRDRARALVKPWLELTRTTQGWGMFAPNPPRHNVFMKVLVTDGDGEVWDMRTDVYARERRPLPFVWNDRMRKMSRRIIGGESGGGDWYRKWYARWHCRQWALEHDGRLPRSVELVKLSYAIPSPEAMRDLGWYRPMDRLRDWGTHSSVHTEHCATAVLGQPIAEVAERHGIAVTNPRPWIKRRRAAWQKRRRAAGDVHADASPGR